MIFARGVVPKTNESLVGFLMRVGEANRLSTAFVFETLRGRVVCPRRVEAAVQIAAACHCSVPEVAQLFGFEHPHPSGARAWRLDREWITKSNFVASRKMAVCTECLSHERYLPGRWELTFYSCCPEHGTELLRSCPRCGKTLRWTRPGVSQCGCGFDLRKARSVPADELSLTVARLIEAKAMGRPMRMSIEGIPAKVMDRLVDLSLDGLFKTLWFLGHRLGEFEACTSGHGRQKPRGTDVSGVIQRALALLSGWPTSLRDRCEAIEHAASAKRSTRVYSRAFKPILAYLDEDFTSQELAFVRAAYEQHVRQLWRDRGLAPPISLGPQLEFEFDPR